MPSYRTYVLALVAVWGVLDAATAAYAIHLNWVYEAGLVIGYALDASGLGARGYGPIVAVAVKLAFAAALYAVLRIEWVAENLQAVPGWQVAGAAAILASLWFGPFSNLVFILKVEWPAAYDVVVSVASVVL